MKLFALLNHFVELHRQNTGWECYYYLLLERNFDQLHMFHFVVDQSHLFKKEMFPKMMVLMAWVWQVT